MATKRVGSSRGPTIFLLATTFLGIALALMVWWGGEGASQAEVERIKSLELLLLRKVNESFEEQLKYKMRFLAEQLPKNEPDTREEKRALEELLYSLDLEIGFRQYDEQGKELFESSLLGMVSLLPEVHESDAQRLLDWARDTDNKFESLIEFDVSADPRRSSLIRYSMPIWSSDPEPKFERLLCVWINSGPLFRKYLLPTFLPESYCFALYWTLEMEEAGELPIIVFHFGEGQMDRARGADSTAFVKALQEQTTVLQERTEDAATVSVPRRIGGTRREVIAFVPMVFGTERWIIGLSTPYDVVVENSQKSGLVGLGLLGLAALLWGIGLNYFLRARQEIHATELAEAQIAESHRREHSVIAENPIAVLVFDAGGRLVDCNYSAERLLGLSRQEALGLQPADFFDEDSIQSYWETLQRQGNFHAREAQLVRKSDDAPKMVEFWGRNIGENWVLMAHDVEQHRDIEVQMSRFRRMDSMGALALTLAHDFNNLLGQMQILVSNLRADAAPGSEISQGLETIEEKVDDATQLVSELLSFRQGGVVSDEPIYLEQVLRDFVTHQRQVLPKEVELLFDIRGDMPSVWITPHALRRILDNLYINACDAMPYGGTLRIRGYSRKIPPFKATRQLPADNYSVIEVSDTGIGMSPETLDSIFEPFFTTKKKGTGLGLWTVYNIIRRVGGWIVPASRSGKGTTFTIYLPNSPPRFEGSRQRLTAPSPILPDANDSEATSETNVAYTQSQ